MSILIPYEATEVTWIVEWDTEVHKFINGVERRLARRLYPKESYQFTYDVDPDDLHTIRNQQAADADQEFRVPFRYDSLRSKNVISGTSIQVDSDYSDWVAATQRVLVEGDAGAYYQTTINSVAGHPGAATLTMADSPGVGSYPIGSRISKLISLSIDDELRTQWRRTDSGIWTLAGRDNTVHATWGTGGTLTTYDSITVLDKYPLSPDTVEESDQAGLEKLDLGGKFEVDTDWDNGDPIRFLGYHVRNSSAEWAYWRKFLQERRGRQKSFLLPTYRADLNKTGGGSISGGATTITIDQDPGLIAWRNLIGHNWFAFVRSSGVLEYVTVTNIVDNANGTETITFSPAFSGTAYVRICMLERCRLEADAMVVSIKHGMQRAEVALGARVVRQ